MSTNAKISIIGNLVRDPVLNQAGSSDVCNFTVAVNTSKREDGTYNANLYDCSIWNEKGRYYYTKLQKSTQVVLWGDLEVVERVNQAGRPVSRLRIDVDDLRITNGMRGREAGMPTEEKKNDETETSGTTE